MDWALVATVIGILTGLLGILREINNMRKAQDEAVRAQAVRDTKLDDKLERIEERLTEHNNYASLFADVKGDIREMKNDIKWLKEAQ